MKTNTSVLFFAAAALTACGSPDQVSERPAAEQLAAVTSAAPDRHVELEGQHNFRDVGGYETADGRTVKWGQVYRSGQLPDLSSSDVERLRARVESDRGIPPDEVDMTNVEAFYYLEAHYIDGALEKAVEDYGSMEAYIRDGLGITDEELDRLREELLE